MKKILLKINGMHCQSCATLISEELEELGVQSKVDYKKGTAEINFDGTKVSLEKIKEVIKKEGYKLE